MKKLWTAHYVQPGLKTLRNCRCIRNHKSYKPRVTIHRPFQVGIAVYQLAKLRILDLYHDFHDFLDHFVDRKDFELIQMDTDSLYFALSANKLQKS